MAAVRSIDAVWFASQVSATGKVNIEGGGNTKTKTYAHDGGGLSIEMLSSCGFTERRNEGMNSASRDEKAEKAERRMKNERKTQK